MQPANDNLAIARELWEAVRELEKQDRKMNQTSKITMRESDYQISLMRNDQELMKFYGTEPILMVLAEIWEKDITCNKTIKAAVDMGLATNIGAL